MKTTTAYKISMAIPLLTPILINKISPSLEYGTTIYKWVFLIENSIIIGAIPYIAISIGALLWMRNKNEIQINRLMVASPIIMAITLELVLLFGNIFSPPIIIEDIKYNTKLIFGSCVVVGYSYVAFVYGSIKVLKMLNLLK